MLSKKRSAATSLQHGDTLYSVAPRRCMSSDNLTDLAYENHPNLKAPPVATDTSWSLLEPSARELLRQGNGPNKRHLASGEAVSGVNGSTSVHTSRTSAPRPKLPLASFNHIAREVANAEITRQFYVDILGFIQVPRPPFDCLGYWLYGYGLSLHLVQSNFVAQRKRLKIDRLRHFTTALPRVDHIAFISDDLHTIKEILDTAKVFYKYDAPANTGIKQLFIFDPDGNVIEVSNCQPPVGMIACKTNTAAEEQEIRDSILNSAGDISNTNAVGNHDHNHTPLALETVPSTLASEVSLCGLGAGKGLKSGSFHNFMEFKMNDGDVQEALLGCTEQLFGGRGDFGDVTVFAESDTVDNVDNDSHSLSGLDASGSLRSKIKDAHDDLTSSSDSSVA